ncbi:MAG: glycoside hydrolase family 2 protein [Bacteroidia bacterium]
MRIRLRLLALFICLCLGMLPALAQSPETIDLNGPWQFREAGTKEKEWLPATVPGTVHTDLFAAKLIPDPYYGNNEADLQWIEQLDWDYRKTFRLTEQQIQRSHADLIFKGLDTYAEVYLNEQLLGRCDNMHRTWVFACKPYLKVGNNELRIRFLSPIQQALPLLRASAFPLPSGNEPVADKVAPWVRKAAYHFGWDFGPRFVTSGIWRPATLRLWDDVLVERVHATSPPGNLSMQEAPIRATVDLQVGVSGNYQVDILVDGELALSTNRDLERGQQRVYLQFSIQQPELWWPRGMGKQRMYTVTAKVSRSQSLLDQGSARIGLRKVRLVQEHDVIGTSFYFLVNEGFPGGGKLFMKGANHVPADMFLPRSAAKQLSLLEDAEAVGMNMIRVWGGGVYADDAFYDWCDAHGMLVWQDLAFACMMYPLEGNLLETSLIEVEDNVLRLRNHPSLAIWCGNNEVDVAWHNWGWQQQFGYTPEFGDKLWGEYQHFFEDRLPNILNTLDPGRPWISTSPLSNWGKEENFKHHNMHYWGVWHGTDSLDGFSRYVPRFMSEYGFQSWPSVATLQSWVDADDLNLDSLAIGIRQKSYKGNAPILRFLEGTYGSPKGLSDLAIKSQLLQRDAMKLAITAHRSNPAWCAGTLYWQLGDCWPGASWSTIDYEGNWKAAHYALKRLYGPVLLSATLHGDSIRVTIASELPERLANLQVRLKSFSGDVLADYERAVTLTPGAATYLELPLAALSSNFPRNSSLIEVVLHRGREVLSDDLAYFVAPKDMDLPDPDFSYKVTGHGESYRIDLQSTTLVKDIQIQVADADGARFSENFFDLVPGRPKSVMLTIKGISSQEDLLDRLRFRDLSRILK